MKLVSKSLARALALIPIAILLQSMHAESPSSSSSSNSIVLGGGCFWCIEALYDTVDGVSNVVSGYSGGSVSNPSYKAVCSGSTGHAEVVRVEFDPEKISLEEIINFFWKAHDPTTLNRQGADVGTQYRSVIYFNSPEQEATAKASMAKAQKDLADPIVTEIKPLGDFFVAENYHQDYFENNPQAAYCRYVILPKLKKLDQ